MLIYFIGSKAHPLSVKSIARFKGKNNFPGPLLLVHIRERSLHRKRKRNVLAGNAKGNAPLRPFSLCLNGSEMAAR